MTYKKRDDNDFNVNEFQITERNLTALNGFTDLNLQGESAYSNEAFSMEGENEEFNKMKIGDDQFENVLMLMNIQKMEKRDFFAEIRAQLDLDHYLNDIIIQFKEDQFSYGTILKNLTEEMLKEEKIQPEFNELKSNFFVEQMEVDLTNKVQSISTDAKGNSYHDESWVCAMGTMAKLKRKKIGLAVLANKTNLGPKASEVQFVLLILSPKREKVTKNSYETARTFATLFTNKSFRERLTQTKDRQTAIRLIEEYWEKLTNECKANQKMNYKNEYFDSKTYLSPGLGIARDIKKRYSVYLSDYLDGFRGEKTIPKCLATTLFLFFSIILPAIAFGVLNSSNTAGKIDVSRALIGQGLGGLFFALFSGQHMIVLGTTALVSLYTKVIYELSNQLGADFYAMYACCGLWSTLFVFLYSFFGISYIIKYCTRSVEEIFAMFIMICFAVDAVRDTYHNINQYYHSPACSNETLLNTTVDGVLVRPCEPENSLCFLLLMLGTVWLSLKIYNFNRTQYLTEKQRDIISTYALPLSVLIFSVVSAVVFKGIDVEKFEFQTKSVLERAKIETLDTKCVFICAGLGFALSILFFMDQNITGQIVNSPTNNMKKGPAPHLDLFVLGILNGFLAVFALPYMHGILPQSPLHVVMMADQEEKLVENHYERLITKVRETRVTSILCNVLILLCFFLIPDYIKLIPVPVLDGLFLYCAIASLRGNSFFERFLLLFTEQANYPPKFYIRRCPQKDLHVFTILQILQLIVVTVVGYHSSAYVQMAFPLIIALLIPFRYTIVPLFIRKKYLSALEAYD